jgi:hypothetical protein
MLLRQIKPRHALRIRALLRHRRYTSPFRALTAGTVTISWSVLSPARRGKSGSRRRVVIANGSVTLLQPGTTRLVLKLTKRGRQLIKHTSRLSVTAHGKLARPDGTALLAATAFALKP